MKQSTDFLIKVAGSGFLGTMTRSEMEQQRAEYEKAIEAARQAGEKQMADFQNDVGSRVGKNHMNSTMAYGAGGAGVGAGLGGLLSLVIGRNDETPEEKKRRALKLILGGAGVGALTGGIGRYMQEPSAIDLLSGVAGSAKDAIQKAAESGGDVGIGRLQEIKDFIAPMLRRH